MKKFISLLCVLLVMLLLFGCSMNAEPNSGTFDVAHAHSSSLKGGSDDLEPSGISGEWYSIGGGGGAELYDEDGDLTARDEYQNQLRAGNITASATMDNEKYDFWHSLLVSGQEEDGEFKNYNTKYSFKTANRLVITLPKGIIAKVSLMNDNEAVFTGVSDQNGVCYLFSNEEKESYNIKVEYLNKDNNLVSFDDVVTGDKEYTDLEFIERNTNIIDLAFVIDATGSMGDEMEYLKIEISDVIGKIKEENGNITVRLAIIVYRDNGDLYVVKDRNFTEDIDTQVAFLKQQSAGGGGDFEEAVDQALDSAKNLSWTEGDSTKVLVFVADAPSHDKDVQKWSNLTLEFAKMGVRILTVASSGIDKKTEYFFRCQSIITGGVYVHITNDSGIGGDHIEASTEEKEEVELLNDCLVRIINGFHTGDFGTPINWQQSQTSPLS